jgi:hypothetical protein
VSHRMSRDHCALPCDTQQNGWVASLTASPPVLDREKCLSQPVAPISINRIDGNVRAIGRPLEFG